MVHHRQGLPLGFEAGDHLPRVHARLDDLQRHAALHRPLLLGQEHHAEAAFADLLQQLVGADHCAGLLDNWWCRIDCRDANGRRLQKTSQRLFVLQRARRLRRAASRFRHIAPL